MQKHRSNKFHQKISTLSSVLGPSKKKFQTDRPQKSLNLRILTMSGLSLFMESFYLSSEFLVLALDHPSRKYFFSKEYNINLIKSQRELISNNSIEGFIKEEVSNYNQLNPKRFNNLLVQYVHTCHLQVQYVHNCSILSPENKVTVSQPFNFQ